MPEPDVLEWSCASLAALFDHPANPIAPPPAEESAVGRAASALMAALAATPRVATEADHVRLFINAPGGAAAPPYASHYLDGELLGPAARFAAEAYARQGLEMDVAAGEPPDALAVELEFLAVLARRERAARGAGDPAALAGIATDRRRFLDDHAARWIPAFVAAIRAADPGPVFAAAATVLDRWLAAERARPAVEVGNASRPPRNRGL
jgi:TorA maturation chaperone TorD